MYRPSTTLREGRLPISTLFVSNSAGPSEGFFLSKFYQLSSLYYPCSEKVPKRRFTVHGPLAICHAVPFHPCVYHIGPTRVIWVPCIRLYICRLPWYTRVGDLCAIWVAAMHISCVRHEITKFGHKHASHLLRSYSIIFNG